jgi:ATP-binding cassette subfamily B protein RaxB
MINYDLQIQQAECGLACIAAVLKNKGSNISLRELRSRFNISSRGTNLNDLKEISSKNGLLARALKVEKDEIQDLKLPAIIHWNFDHYVVLEKIKKNRFFIFDPAVGHREISHSEFFDSYTGVALEMSKLKTFKEKTKKDTLKFSSIIKVNSDIKKTFFFAISFFFLTEVFVLLTPIFLRFTIDQSVSDGSLQIVFFVSISFGLFAIVNTFADYLKERAFIRLNLLFGWDMTIRLFMHMLRLPMKWFDKRILADILTRFDSLEPIKSMLSTGAITTMLNGVFISVLIILLFWLSTALALIVILSVLITVIIKLATLKKSLHLAADAFLATINEKTRKIETIKGIQSIKTSSGESKIESEWFNTFSNVISTQEKNLIYDTKVNIAIKTIDNIIFVLIIYNGVSLILSNSLSVGTLFAFMSYRTMFTGRFNALIDIFIQFKLLSIHTNRIADLVLEEKDEDNNLNNGLMLEGSIEVKNLAFTYSSYENTVFQNLNISVKPGEFFSIVGKSGCGKSTFLKVLLGLYKPSFGDILFDNVSINNLGATNVRKRIGTVLQNDCLFKGTIADNVTFFSEEFDEEKIYKCLEIACIKDDVINLPMGINSDVGNSFSAGQVQRILIARALYKKPKVIVMDEATSNLNVEIENRILENIRNLEVTVVIVSHRKSIIDFSDRVFDFEKQALIENKKENLNAESE